MKRLMILLLLSVLTVSVGWLFGCGSKSTDSAPKVVGDTNSVEFQTASSTFEMTGELDGEVIGGTLELFGSLVTPAPPRQNQPASASDPVFHEGSMYWYRVNVATETTFVVGHPDLIANISDWVRIDSLQFLHLDTPKMIPDPASVTEIKAGVQLDGHSLMTDDSVHATRYLQIVCEPGSLAAHGDVVINAGGNTVAGLTISKTHRDTVTTCQVGLNMASVWSNLAINLAAVNDSGKCPTAGTMTWNGTMSVACARGDDSVKFNGGWSASQTFNGDQATYVVENATTRWTMTETCGEQPVASPFRRHSNPLQ